MTLRLSFGFAPLAFLLGAFQPPAARAQTGGAASTVASEPLDPPPAPRGSSWYGWQTLVSDGSTLATTMVLGGGNAPSGMTAANLVVGFGLGPAIVHVTHGRPLVALADVLIRGFSVVGGGALGGMLASCPQPQDNGMCGFQGVAAGVLLGALGAIVLDATALSWEKPRPHHDKGAPDGGFSWAPTVLVSKDSVAFGGRANATPGSTSSFAIGIGGTF